MTKHNLEKHRNKIFFPQLINDSDIWRDLLI